MNYYEACQRVTNLEPFTDAELGEVKALPGVTITFGPRVRSGTILSKIEARDISLLDDWARQ